MTTDSDSLVDTVSAQDEVAANEAALRALWEKFKATGDQGTREHLILHYSPLVKYVAGRVGVDLAEERVGTTAPGMVAKSGQSCVVHGAEPGEELAHEVERLMEGERPALCALRWCRSSTSSPWGASTPPKRRACCGLKARSTSSARAT